MSTVAEIAVEYAAKGSKAAVRADRSVRDSIQDTAKSAQSESSTINRWMERHKSAVQMVGMATAGVMGAILSASPTMRSELAGTRMAFSLWADTVVDDVLPSGTSLTEMAFDVEQAYRDLPDPVRESVSSLIAWAGIIGGVVAVGITASKVIGVFAGAIFPLIKAVAFAAGAIAGLIGTIGALPVAIGAALAAVVAFTVGFIFNIGGMRDRTIEILTGMLSWIDDRLGGLPSDAVSWGKDLPSSLADGIKSTLSDPRGAAGSVRDAIQERIPDPLEDAYSWGSDTAADLGSGIANKLSDARGAAGDIRDAIAERIPDPLEDAYDWGKDTASDLGRGLVNNAFRAGSAARDVASEIDDVLGGIPSDAYDWGKDIVSEMISGLKSLTDRVESAAGSVRSTVEDYLSFDRVENDRAARRWGSDLLEEMSTGILSETHTLESAVQQPDLQPQPPTTAAGGGGSATVIIEQITVNDAGSPRRTASKTADEVSRAIQDNFGAMR